MLAKTECRIGNKTINKFLALYFLDYVLVIIISERSRKLIVIHIVLVFPETP